MKKTKLSVVVGSFLAVLCIVALAARYEDLVVTKLTAEGAAVFESTVSLAGAVSSTAAIGTSGTLASTTSADGISTRVIARASIDSSDWALGTTSLGITIPDNSVVVGGYIDITSAFLSATNGTDTTALSLNTAGDLRAALTNNASSVGIKALIPVWTAATAIKTTNDMTLKFVKAGGALTGGVATVVIEYDRMAR